MFFETSEKFFCGMLAFLDFIFFAIGLTLSILAFNQPDSHRIFMIVCFSVFTFMILMNTLNSFFYFLTEKMHPILTRIYLITRLVSFGLLLALVIEQLWPILSTIYQEKFGYGLLLSLLLLILLAFVFFNVSWTLAMGKILSSSLVQSDKNIELSLAENQGEVSKNGEAVTVIDLKSY